MGLSFFATNCQDSGTPPADNYGYISQLLNLTTVVLLDVMHFSLDGFHALDKFFFTKTLFFQAGAV